MLDDAPVEMKPAQATVDMYLRLLPALEREVQAVAAGLSVENGGTLRLTTRGRLNPAGRLAALVADSGTSRGNLLSGLPAKPFVFAAGASLPQQFFQNMMQSLGGIAEHPPALAAPIAKGGQKILDGSRTSVKGAHSVALMMAAIGADTPVCRDFIGVVRTDDPQEDLHSSLKTVGTLLDGNKDTTIKSYHLDNARILDRDAICLTFTIPRNQQSMLGLDAMLEKFVGAGGRIVAYLIAADQQHLVFGCQAKNELLQQALDALQPSDKGFSANAQVAQTAALLPRNPLAIAYVSPQGAITLANRFLTQLPPFRAAPEFPASPAIGFALTTAPGELHGQLVLPVEVLRGIRGYFR
jgi:hypothetical protein